VTHAEGYKQAEWVLLDYVDFVVHIFSEKARQFYDLERLWKSAKRLEPAELLAKPKTRRTGTAAKNSGLAETSEVTSDVASRGTSPVTSRVGRARKKA
jgi:ribosome-associated protein